VTDARPSPGTQDAAVIRSLPVIDDHGPRAEVVPFVRKDTSTGDGVHAGIGVSDPVSRWVLLIAGMCALAVTFVQEPGRIVSDSKLPVLMAPLAFMANSLHLWDQSMWSGSIKTLDFGYIFPMGLFFGAAHLLHIPVWISERAWLALLLTIGFWGMVRLAEALRIGTRTGRVLGAVVYVVAPIVVTWSASSVSLLAVVLLPWVLVPLVRGASGGSPRRAACASGLAVALMGGVNSTVVLATLPVGAIWLLTRRPGRRRRALMTWWVIALALACFWWAAAGSIQSRFGYNYLPYTETAKVTTATTSLFESLHGASYWVNYFTLGGPLIRGVWTLVSTVGPILGTTVVVAFGLIGLTRRIPERLFLVATLALGVLVIAAGYGGALGGPLAGPVQHLLGAQLAILRNVSKFSPDVALPLALGFASVVSSPLQLRRRARERRDARLTVRGAGWVGRTVFALVIAAAVILAATPFWNRELYPQGSFTAIPTYWTQTADWLGAHQDHGTALLAPGASFGEYTWGRPIDEPLTVLTETSWSVRSLVPVGSNGNDQVLDAVESSLDSGVAAPGMAQFLARSGFDYVVVRNDLDLTATKAPAPAQVRQVLSQTPGLKLVASFGPVISQKQANPTGMPVYDTSSFTHGLRSVQIYRVESPSPAVKAYPVSDPVIVSGSPSSLLVLLEEKILTGRPAFLAGDIGSQAAAAQPNATWADTDGNQRRDSGYGSIRNDQSYVLGPDQRSPIAQAQVPQSLAVVSGTQHQTVNDPLGAASVSTSSFSSSPLTLDSAQGPSAAFDNNLATAWVADAKDNSVGQWVQINFGRSLDLHDITVRPLADGAQRPKVTGVEISTARGTVERTIRSGANVVAVSPGSSSWLRVTLTTVQRASVQPISVFPLGAGLTSVAIPGVHYAQALSTPADESSAFAQRGGQVVFAFDSPVTNANLTLGQTNDDDPLMVRRFKAPASTKVSMLGQATPNPGTALNALLPAVTSSVKVTASSTLGQLPRFDATNLITASGRPWIAGQGDAQPSLTFSWSGDRTVSSIVLKPSSDAARPIGVNISSPSGQILERVPAHGGTISFPPMTTDTLTIQFVKVARTIGHVPASGTRFVLPVGVARLSIPALGHVTATTAANRAVVLPCGTGPTVTLDGQALQTQVRGTLSQLENLEPMGLAVCGGPTTIAAGSHVLQAGRLDGAFKVTNLQALPATEPHTPASRSTQIVGPWGAANRQIKVGPGAESYLAVAQNYNTGWKAVLNGRSLTPVRLDGWQQGWVIPAGAGGTVVMTFPADAWYRLALLVGAFFVAALAAFALARRGRRAQPPAPERKPLPRVLVGIACFVVLAVVSGPLALVLLPLAAAGRRWGRQVLALIAGCSFVAAGIAVAAIPGAEPPMGVGAFGWPAQLFAAIALGAVLAGLVLPEKEADPAPAAGIPTGERVR
jgi:arabinofuranan 3-O-arabinosyltransferase